MDDYRSEFLDYALECGVLRFGEFTLKSGRVSPYFFNTGLFNTGVRLKKLGEYYARAISDAGVEFDMLFGPAYKGIPLAAAVSIGFAALFDRDVPYAFDRKEVKAHGEGGKLIGAPMEGRVLIIDDVISAGTSARIARDLIREYGGVAAGMAIALDRQERGKGETSAVDEVRESLGAPVISIANLDRLLEYLAHRPKLADSLTAVERYRAQYGAAQKR